MKLVKDINELKIILANETTKILHGDKKSLKAEKTANDIFKLGKIYENLPTINISKKDIETGIKFLDLLVNANIMKSKGEVRRAIKNNGVKIKIFGSRKNLPNKCKGTKLFS